MLNTIVAELARKGVTLDHSQVHRRIEGVLNGQVSNLHIPEETQLHIVPEELQIYTVWKVFSMPEEQMKYPGQTPRQIIENLLWYYTEPFDVVLDPTAGSGMIIDVCKAM